MKVVKNDRGESFAIDDNDNLIDGVLIKVELSDIINADLEGWLDRISEDAGFPLLTEQSYNVEGHEGNVLLLRVWGNVAMDLDFTEENTGGNKWLKRKTPESRKCSV